MRVTVSDEVKVARADGPRERSETRFVVRGELDSLARLLTAGPLRRRLGRRIASVHGDRRELAVLRSLMHSPLTVEQLREAGVRLDASLALAVVALLVRPEWTKGESFVLAYQDPGASSPSLFLQVRNGERLRPSARAPLGEPEATVISAPADLLGALGAVPDTQFELRGEARPAKLLAGWINRALSG